MGVASFGMCQQSSEAGVEAGKEKNERTLDVDDESTLSFFHF